MCHFQVNLILNKLHLSLEENKNEKIVASSWLDQLDILYVIPFSFLCIVIVSFKFKKFLKKSYKKSQNLRKCNIYKNVTFEL